MTADQEYIAWRLRVEEALLAKYLKQYQEAADHRLLVLPCRQTVH
jgi:hypothetical protein